MWNKTVRHTPNLSSAIRTCHLCHESRIVASGLRLLSHFWSRSDSSSDVGPPYTPPQIPAILVDSFVPGAHRRKEYTGSTGEPIKVSGKGGYHSCLTVTSRLDTCLRHRFYTLLRPDRRQSTAYQNMAGGITGNCRRKADCFPVSPIVTTASKMMMATLPSTLPFFCC